MLKPSLCALLMVASAGASSLALAVSVTTQNKCDNPVAIKIERKGSTLNTTLSQRTSSSHNLDAGDKIKVGNNVVHTVSSSSNGQTVVVCSK